MDRWGIDQIIIAAIGVVFWVFAAICVAMGIAIEMGR